MSQLLMSTDQTGKVTKYVYGLGLIGEDNLTTFKTYHFDLRGSTVAITNTKGAVIDTFKYDTYGKVIKRTGTTNTPFQYNGRDGVMTDENGLLYMRKKLPRWQGRFYRNDRKYYRTVWRGIGENQSCI